MKTKIKRHSRSVISVVLAVCMLISCMMVGLIATDAAKVTGEEAVGVGALTFRYKLGDGTWSDLSVTQTSGVYGSNTFTVDSSGTLYCWFKESSNSNYYGNQQFTAPSSEGDYKSLAQMNGIDDSNYQTNTNNVNKVALSSSGTYTVKVNFSENKFTIFGGSGGSGGSTEPTTAPEETGTTYYYRGDDNSWGATAMTTSTDGYYAYIQSSNSNNQFKIATSTTGWDYNYTYVDKGFNGTNVTSIGDHASDNCKCWQSGTYYILVYYPNTDINTTDKPKICASTTLPYDANHVVTFTAGTGGSITPNTATRVRESTAMPVTANANDGYDFSGWTFGDGITYSESGNTATIKTKSSGTYTVQANFTKKPVYTVTAKSNDTALGTVSASPTAAYQGQTVTVTYAENTGDYDSEAGYQITDAQGTNIASSVGASINTTSKTITFTMPNNAVVVKVNFKEYAGGNSDYYYNSYDSSDGTVQDGAPYGLRMQNLKNNGNVYSYAYISPEDRNQVDQTFTVSHYSAAHSGTIYWQRPDSWGNHDYWSNDKPQKAKFFASDGSVLVGHDWDNMGSNGDYTSGNMIFHIDVPWGAKYVQFYDDRESYGQKNHTKQIDLSTIGADQDMFWPTTNDPGSYGVEYGHGSSGFDGAANPVAQGFTEYFNGDTNIAYTNGFKTKGFQSHNIGDHNYTKPNENLSTHEGYYVLLLYAGKEYDINGVKTTVDKNTVIWLPELPGTTSNNAIVYAKDGSLRNDSGSTVYKKFANYATTQITNAGIGSVRKDDDYDYLKHEKDDTELTITTTIDAGDYRDNYYVKGFSVNGVTPELLTPNDDGVYTLKITLGEDKITFDGGEVDYINDKYVEITPIYYTKDSSNSVTFYVRGFDDTVKASWGDTIAAYPFYNGASNVECAFGGYPGQPLINYGGKLFIDVPLSVTNSSDEPCTIQGITMSNYYWDRIHGTTNSENNLLHIKAVKSHVQTYDYDDFSKIYTEVKEQNKSPETIVFDFKYRTAQNNEYSATLGSTYANGWDDMVNAQGALVDIFGNELSDSDQAKSPIYVVSDGYWNNYTGAYSTEWHVYQNDGTFIGTINPSVRWVQSADRLSETVYPYGGKAEYLNIYHKLSSFADEYTALQAYKNTPVKITFEEEIRNESGQSGWDGYNHNSNDYDKAKRSDGLWMYSFNGTKINANTVIEYSDDDGTTYTVDPYNTGSNVSSKGMKAYFTNSDFNGETSVETRSNNEDFFKFTAESAGEYIFVGWYNKEMDGSTAKYLRISTAVNGQSSMESGGTFVARFIKNPSGQLTLSHTILKDETYKGDGTATIKVEVKDAENTVVKTYNGITTGESEFTIPNTYIKYNHGYTLTVTLNTVPKGDDTFAQFTTSVNSKFYNNATESTGTNPATSVFSFDVDDLFEYDSENDHYNQTTKVLRYYSQLTEVKYTYKMTYHYTSYREKKGKQTYYVEKTFTEDDIKNYLQKSNAVKDADNENIPTTAYDFKDTAARKAFIDKYGPYENNFRINLSWNAELGSDGTTIVYYGNTKTYEIDVHTATKLNDIVDLQIKLPYAYGSKAQNYKAIADSTTGNINYNYSYTAIDINNLTQMTWYSTNGPKTYDDPNNQPVFVTAPKVIYAGTIPLYFRYWSVKTQPSDTNPDKVEYTRCYYPEFNLAIYQDSYVEPVYTELTDTEKAAGYTPTPHAEAMKDNTGATITFMENSRNQYNKSGCGSETKASRKLQGDRVFTDFLISFASDSDVKYNTFGNGTYTAGIAIERVAKLPKNEMGDYYTQAETVYQTAYGKTLSGITPIDNKYDTKAAEVKAFIEGKVDYTTDSNTENEVVFQRSEFDANKLDNKNRLDYYYSMSVRNHTGDFVNNHNSEYIYRAYSYIKDSSGKVVMLSETPLYFTIYDMASIANAADGTVYDNPTS